MPKVKKLQWYESKQEDGNESVVFHKGYMPFGESKSSAYAFKFAEVQRIVRESCVRIYFEIEGSRLICGTVTEAKELCQSRYEEFVLSLLELEAAE